MKRLLPLALVALAHAAVAGEFQVSQANKAFSTAELKIKVGDTVVFTNNDSFAHNTFSLSETKSFDLGSFGQGQSRKVTFDKPGSVDVECALHPGMKMTVLVQK